MCFPIAIPAIGIAMTATQTAMAATVAATVAATALTAAGQNQSAHAQNAANKYNAEIATQQATDAQRRGAMAEAEKRQESQLRASAAIAQMGASGTLPSAGSNLDILAQSAEYGARSAATARINAGREAWGYNSQAELDRYYGRSALALSKGQIAATSLTGATKLFSQASNYWNGWQKPDESFDYFSKSNYGYKN